MSELQNKAKLQQRGIEDQIEQLLQDENIAGATELLAENAVSAAMEKDFMTAENLRDRLLAVNPNALFEVIRVNAAIEKEKGGAISKHYLSLWHQLYEFLEPDAFSALYHCQRFKNYQADEVIVQQGDLNPTLYFINEGRVGLTYRQGRKEMFIQQMSPGEIIGCGPFFDVSVWTVSLVAMTDVKVQALERQAFLKLLPPYPGLETSLADFCRRSDKVPELLKKMEENRREDMRHPVQLIFVNSLLGTNENSPPQSFKAQLEDISLGGFSLSIRISQKEKIRLLLGRGLISSLPLGIDKVQERSGKIVGVTLYDYMEKKYSVHVRFDQPLSTEELDSILLHGRK
ncbi:MAG: cyclic nucleotide-binding domain-containing protein [Deltaproteobacteria bacterium]|nr:cyclic nucleotide-binding domain-containing protein [Deltaproteobacteria bacterium]